MTRYKPNTHDLQQMSIIAVGIAVVWAFNASWWALVPWIIGPVFFIWKMHRWRITQSPKPSVSRSDCLLRTLSEPMSHFLYRPTTEQIDLLQWHVEELDLNTGNVDRIIAIVCNPIIAIETAKAAADHWPEKRFICRHGSRIISQHWPAGSADRAGVPMARD